jgi:hypothetical protein
MFRGAGLSPNSAAPSQEALGESLDLVPVGLPLCIEPQKPELSCGLERGVFEPGEVAGERGARVAV